MPSLLQPLVSRPSGPIKGEITPPGDKSISHRAIMLGGIAEGTTSVRGLLEGEDVLRTIAALRKLGAKVEKSADGTWHITGEGLAQLHPSKNVMDMGNSGTAARLLIGLLAGRPFTSSFTGDASLCKRPMGRVIDPLTQMGAIFKSTDGKLPLSVTGSATPTAISYRLPVPSAQVKSAILLAGLSASGVTTVIETTPTRDHSENMLRHFGATVSVERRKDDEAISVAGGQRLIAKDITVPGDISSAAFPIVAALLRPGSTLTVNHVGMNPRRAGLIDTLIEMGAKITLQNKRTEGGEAVADLVIRGTGELKGVTVPAERAASMIDEYPILAAAAACAQGQTRMLGLHELRVKESDRLTRIADGLARCGVKLEVKGDDLIINGTGHPPAGNATIETAMDHRIAMSFLVLGAATQSPIRIDDGSFISTSFPGFVNIMNGLGMKIENAKASA
jgi:3-phosphoshikimate 1-carboxyvinyltransferase